MNTHIIPSTLLCLVLFAAPAFASPITHEFFGTMTSGTGSGSFTVDTALAPVLVNRGGLSNLVYQPSSWDFSLLSTFIGNGAFSNTLAGHTAEWCVGICTFGSGQQVRLDLRNGADLLFHFAFGLSAAGEIGGAQQAVYEFNDGNGARRISVFNTSALSQTAVPEPAAGILLLIGLGMLARRFYRTVVMGL